MNNGKTCDFPYDSFGGGGGVLSVMGFPEHQYWHQESDMKISETTVF